MTDLTLLRLPVNKCRKKKDFSYHENTSVTRLAFEANFHAFLPCREVHSKWHRSRGDRLRRKHPLLAPRKRDCLTSATSFWQFWRRH